MSSWTERRRKLKFEAKISLSGSLFKGVWLTMILLTVSMLSLSFLPIKVPQLPSNVSDVSKLTTLQLLKLFLPDPITFQHVALAVLTIVLFLLLTSPLKVGMHRFFLLSTRGEKPKFRVAFLNYTRLSQVFGSMLLILSTALISLIWGIILFGVPLLLLYFAPTLGPIATIIGMPLYFLALPAMLVAIAPYALIPFIYAENPKYGVFKCIRAVIRRTRGVRIEFALFQFTFVPWRIMVACTYPFGAFFFTPYELSAYAKFFDTIDSRRAVTK